MGKAIGIDAGTYNSAAAVALGRDQVVMVESRHGKSLNGKNFPSFVLFDHIGQKQKVGKPAKGELRNNPKLVIWGTKRLIGLSFKEAKEAEKEFSRFQYNIEEGSGGSILVKVGNERYTPSHILEYILREIKEDAENQTINPLLGGKIEKAVVSVPAYFGANRTAPIIEAAKNAGFTEVDTIAEPTAAAIRYGLKIDKEATLMAFDLGAGTLDVSVAQVIRGDNGELVPGELSVSGHEALGGIDMDDMLVSYVIKKYKLSDIVKDPDSMNLLKDEIELTKIRLSSHAATYLNLPGGESVDLTRKELEDVLMPLLDRCRKPIRDALRLANRRASQIEHIFFVGGPTKMPCVRNVVKDELMKQGAKSEVLKELEVMETKACLIDPMECVAQGASLKAGKIIEPPGGKIAEGYGTIWNMEEGSTLPDYYKAIIKENSNYPTPEKKLSILHSNANALEVPVKLVAKRPDPDNTKTSEIAYKYIDLCSCTIAISPTGKLPEIDILIKVDNNKKLIVTLVQPETGARVCYEELEQLNGQEIILQDHTPPREWDPEIIPRMPEEALNQTTKRKGWTEDKLERLIHSGQAVLGLVTDPSNPKVQKSIEALRSIIDRAVAEKNPQLCEGISNRTKELLNILSLKNVGQITKDQANQYINELIQIARASE